MRKALLATGVFGLFLALGLGLGGCSKANDPGTGEYHSDGDADSEGESEAAENEGEESAEVEEAPPVAKCAPETIHNNDTDIVAISGGLVHVCLAGDTLDGSQLTLPPRSLNADAHVLIRQVDDLTQSGLTKAGPAVLFELSNKSGSAGLTLQGTKPATFTFPFDTSVVTPEIKNVYVRLLFQPDPKQGTINAPDNAPYALPRSPVSYTIDRSLGLITVTNGYFGTYQAMIPASIPAAATRHYTFRGLSGASMGACATAMLGFPESARYDILGPLGGCMDNGYLLRMLRDFHFGGFCTRQEILQKQDDQGTWTDKTVAEIDAFVKDTTAECGYCGPQHTTQHWATPVNKCYMVKPRDVYKRYNPDPQGLSDEHPQGFNHWYYDSNGANFNRKEDLHLYRDLAYSFGNFSNYNSESPYLAAGLTGARQAKYIKDVLGAASTKAGCVVLADMMKTDPILGFYDGEYNPEAKYPVIAFCDGTSQRTGDYDPADPDAFNEPSDIMLAVDYNGNGIRDYGEPVIRQFWEPFEDCGLDGLCDPDEPGYNAASNPDPNGDDYNPFTNPLGTEGNGLYDDDGTRHEKYEDVGIDGVACPDGKTCAYDYGEKNGKFDYNPHVAKALEIGGAVNVRKMPEEQLKRLNIYMDAGTRDIFNFAMMADGLAGALDAKSGTKTQVYQNFEGTMRPRGADYKYSRINYADLGRNVYVRYGNYTASDASVAAGDGCHVGTTSQVVSRLQTLLAFANAHFPQGDYTPVDKYELNSLVYRTRFYSPAMKRDMVYAIALPPGYFAKNKDGADGAADVCTDRYPVFYVLHGYGMDPSSTATTAAVIFDEVAKGRMQKMIVVFPEGQCQTPDLCRKDCEGECSKNADPAACTSACVTKYDCAHAPTECVRGTFYLDKVATATDPIGNSTAGKSPAPRTQALYDLMDYVDSHFCARAPADIQVDSVSGDALY